MNTLAKNYDKVRTDPECPEELVLIAVRAAVYNYVRFSALCLVKNAGKKIGILWQRLVADGALSLNSFLCLRKTGGTAVNIAELVAVDCCRSKNF